jgi:hypothetical protein
VQADPFIIALMNCSAGWPCRQISLDGQNYSATPLVGKTCSATDNAGFQKCFDQGNYQPIATVNAGQNYNVWLGFRNAEGQIAHTDSPYTFYAKPEVKGEVLIFTD